jgi:hypothetical protein
MPDWQSLGVVLIVAGAVVYLARKFFGRSGTKPATTFVPLSKLKKPGA